MLERVCLQIATMTSPPPIPTLGSPSVSELLGYKEAEIAIDGTVLSRRSCVKCAYNLFGLHQTGICPECGTPVAKSLKGHLLRFASEEYLKTLATGFSLILNGILVTVAFTAIAIIVAILVNLMSNMTNSTITIGFMSFQLPTNYNTGTLESIGNLIQALIGVVIFLGYIKITSEDPGMTGLTYPRKARTTLKVAVIVQIVLNTAVLLFDLISKSRSLGPGWEIAEDAISLISAIAWVVQFFAMMTYCKWLVSRIPDVTLITKITKYTWKLPLIAILLGCLLGLGPLIAMIMYWELLNKIRGHLRQIIESNQQADLPQVST